MRPRRVLYHCFWQMISIQQEKAIWHALADAMREEYRTIIEAGLDLQLDCPDLALSRHMLFNDMSDDEFVKIADMHVDALNHALDGLPKDQIVFIFVGAIMKARIFAIFRWKKCSF